MNFVELFAAIGTTIVGLSALVAAIGAFRRGAAEDQREINKSLNENNISLRNDLKTLQGELIAFRQADFDRQDEIRKLRELVEELTEQRDDEAEARQSALAVADGLKKQVAELEASLQNEVKLRQVLSDENALLKIDIGKLKDLIEGKKDGG